MPPPEDWQLPSTRVSPDGHWQVPSTRLSPDGHWQVPSTKLSPDGHWQVPSTRLSPVGQFPGAFPLASRHRLEFQSQDVPVGHVQVVLDAAGTELPGQVAVAWLSGQVAQAQTGIDGYVAQQRGIPTLTGGVPMVSVPEQLIWGT